MVVEDAMDLAAVLVADLQSAGFDVTHASSGPDGLAAFWKVRPDVVVLDWMLPGMDGSDVLRAIRQQSSTPVLMLTARDEEFDKVLGLELGADDYVTKPFGVRELIARLRALIRRDQRVQQARQADTGDTSQGITVGLLQIQPLEYRALLNGVDLELTRTEFGLLRILAASPGRVFNRAYLVETVWGESALEGDRSVDNAVLRLRRKLGSLAGSIETVWGVGYRFKRPEST